MALHRLAHRRGRALSLLALVVAVIAMGLSGSSAQAAPLTAIRTGQTLVGGQGIDSPNHFVHLIMQTDGNLVVYAGGAAIWNSHTYGHGRSTVTLQTDGNLVLHDAAGAVLWASYSQGSGASDILTVDDFGAATIADAAHRRWWTTGSRASVLRAGYTLLPGQSLTGPTGERLVMQTDGNLVLYRGSTAIWNSVTYGRPGASASLQTDGNLVVRAVGGAPIWVSGTRTPGSGFQLFVQAGGNLALLDAVARPLWQTFTWSTPSGPQLAAQLLSMWGGRFGGESGVLSDLQAVSRGQLITNSSSCGHPVTIDTRLLTVLAKLTSRYLVFLNNIISGHSCDSAMHPKGLATDVERITDPTSGATTNFHAYSRSDNTTLDAQFITYLAGLLPVGAGLGQVECPGHGVRLPAGIEFFGDTCTHQHLQIARDVH